MKFLIPERIIEKAKKYAAASIAYTHNHAGWEDEYNKQERIMRGLAAEYFISDFLRVNGVNVVMDSTSARENDKFDFSVNGKTYDVKASSFAGVQITVPYVNKKIDYIIAAYVNNDATEIQIHGVIPKDKTIEPDCFVKPGDKIPGTLIINRFRDGVYYYRGRYECFFDHFNIISRDMPTDYWRQLWLSLKKYDLAPVD